MSTATPGIDRVVDGRYRVLDQLAQGGMATVYRALDLRLDRPVALKVMRPDLARDPAFVTRFRREARAAARLSHPHVVSVFDQGADGDTVFLAMELVDGATLREQIAAQGPMTARRSAEILDQVLQALAAAHRAGLVHRDIKPENVLLTPAGTVKVADFGLAEAVTVGSTGRTGELLWGTAAYLAPEQVEQGTSDERTDVYAVGLLGYELLTGVKAFPGEHPVQVALAHLHEEVPPAADLVPTVPAELDTVIRAATATDPRERPVDAAALRRVLHRALAMLSDEELDTEPVTPPRSPGGTPYPGSDPTRPVHRPTTVVRLPDRTGPPTGRGHSFARTTGNRPPGAESRRRPTTRRRAHRVLGALLTVLLLLSGVGGAVVAWWFATGPGVHSSVPQLTGLTEGEALAALDARQLDGTVTREFSESVGADVVIAAGTEPGSSLRHGTDVALTVSRGPERYAVPDLIGRTVPEARATLTEAGLALSGTTESYDPVVPPGRIVRATPAPGQPVRRDQAVAVVVSAGPRPVPVAAVIGRSRDAAVATLERAGLVVEVAREEVFDADVPAGSVSAQSPSNGTAVPGDTITLTLSKGPELVPVPQVVGLPWTEAEPLLTDLGLTVQKEEIADAFFGTVRFQSLAEGDQVPVGTEIVVTVL